MIPKKNALNAVLLSSSLLLNGCDMLLDDDQYFNTFNTEQRKQIKEMIIKEIKPEVETAVNQNMSTIDNHIDKKLSERVRMMIEPREQSTNKIQKRDNNASIPDK